MSSTSTSTITLQDLDSNARNVRMSDEVRLSNAFHNGNTESATRNEDEAPPDAVEAIPDGGYGWVVVLGCAVSAFWVGGYVGTWGILQTALLDSKNVHFDVTTTTFVGSLCMATTVAFSLGSVRLHNAFGMRITVVASNVVFCIGLIATSFTLEHIGGLFCIAGLLLGLGGSVIYTATNSLPPQWFSGKLGTATGIIKAGGGLGATVLPIAAQAMIDRVGLQWTFRILGFAYLATALPCAFLMKDRVRTARAARFDWSLLKSMPFLCLALGGAVSVFGLYVPPFFLPLFASSIGLSASTGAGLVAGFGASTTFGRLLGGWSCDRIGAFNALAITCFINGVSMLAIWPVSTSLPPLFVFAIINGCANGAFFAVITTATASLTPGTAASSIGLMTSFWTPGYLLGAPLAGILIQATGAEEATSIGPYRAAIFYAAGTGVLATILVVLARARLDTKVIKKV